MKNVIQQIYDYQHEMYDLTDTTYEERLQEIRNFAVALMMEQAELLEEFPWKPWRTIESQKSKVNLRKVALEVVDMLFFTIGQARVAGISAEDLMAAFETKLENNKRRIASGYSKTRKGENAI